VVGTAGEVHLGDDFESELSGEGGEFAQLAHGHGVRAADVGKGAVADGVLDIDDEHVEAGLGHGADDGKGGGFVVAAFGGLGFEPCGVVVGEVEEESARCEHWLSSLQRFQCSRLRPASAAGLRRRTQVSGRVEYRSFHRRQRRKRRWKPKRKRPRRGAKSAKPEAEEEELNRRSQER